MARYDINYSCGHGATEKNLSGPHKERERYIAWAESTWTCPACRAAEDDKKPITMIASCNGLDEDAQGRILVEIRLEGGTRPRKDQIKAMGYTFGEPRGSIMGGLMATSAPKKCWIRTVPIDEIATADMPEARRIVAEKEALGATFQRDFSAIDIEMIRRRQAAKATDADAKAQARARLDEIKAKDPQPEKSPLFFRISKIAEEKGQKWNGKIYGRKGGYNFYIANEQYTASDAEVAERESINAARAAWEEKYKAEIEAAK